MTEKLAPLIEQISLVSGKWHNTPKNQVAVREPKTSKSYNKGTLFIVADVHGQAERSPEDLQTIASHVLALIRDTYYPASGGITASLRRAFQAANQWLFQYNAKASSGEKIRVGVTLAVVQEQDIFIAQVGPGLAYSRLNEFVNIYPEKARAQAATAEEPALGMYQFIEPNLFHLQVEAGDLLILADSDLARGLDRQIITRAAEDGSRRSFGRTLFELTGLRQGSGIVIRMTDALKTGPTLVERVQEHLPVSEAESIFDRLPISLPPVLAEAGKRFNLTLPDVFFSQEKKTPAKVRPRPTQVAAVASPAAQEPGSPLYSDNVADSAEWGSVYAETSSETERQEARSSIRSTVDPVEGPIWQKVWYMALSALALLGSGLQTVFKLVLPGGQPETAAVRQAGHKVQPVAEPAKGLPPKVLFYVALGIPVVALLITVFTYWQRGYQEETAYLAAVQGAQDTYQQALAAAPSQARPLLDQSEAYMAEAIAMRGAVPELDHLQVEIEQYRDKIDGVQRLFYIPVLKHYDEPGTSLNQVIVQGVDLYVLEKGRNRVYKHTLDDTGDALLPDSGDPVLLQQGRAVDETPVTDIIDMVWMPTGGGRQTSDLLMLTQTGLFEFNPSWGTTVIPLNADLSQMVPVGVGSYFGNFYIMDAQSNQIYRYLPNLDGYETPPEPYFLDTTQVSLLGAVDLAIDGAIYILYQNGTIQKFLGGQLVEFQLTGLEPPLRNPTAIFTASDELVQYLYVADAGNQRIVQLTKEGQFVRSLKPRLDGDILFDDLRSIFVDEIGEKMFVLNGTRLYAPNIPNVQNEIDAAPQLELAPESPATSE